MYCHYTALRFMTRRTYTFRIDPELDAALKAVKESDGMPESEQIRRALRQWFAARGVDVVKADRKRVPARKRP